MESKKNYYAIIPASVRYDEKIRPNAKLLYGELTALSNERGYCWASNQYFAELYGVSKKSVSNWISELRDGGYIHVEMTYKNGSKEIDVRKIYINPMEVMGEGYGRNVPDPMEEKFHTPMEKKVKDNNTVFNNTINNTTKDILSGKPDGVDYNLIIDYLNEKARTSFRSGTKATQRLIDARINEGFGVDDFKIVIDNKVLDWARDERMMQYLRPQTLFGTKFEAYLNEKPKKEQRAKQEMGAKLSEQLGF